jgi:gamma-glutamyltranspeptidase/glutathione hydrolase
MLEDYPLKSYGPNSTQALHILAEVQARSYLNCRGRISDPDFTESSVDRLISKDLAKELGSTINPIAASLPSELTNFPLMPASNTTHLVAIDSERNVVSLTESVECYFGSGITVPGTGMILNDTMHDFEPKPDMVNSVASWKIPMSSMSPTIILKEGRPVMALGSAGGPRIVSSTLQVLLNVIESGMGLEEAVAAPRMHVHGDRVQLEGSVAHEAVMGLRKMGHRVEVRRLKDAQDPGLYFGGVHAAQLSQDNTLNGAPDPRRDGLAIGLP